MKGGAAQAAPERAQSLGDKTKQYRQANNNFDTEHAT